MVEIIPKPVEKIPLWQNILFYFFFGLLLLAVLGYFILGNSIKKAETHGKELEQTLTKAKTPEETALEEEVLGYEKKIKDFSKLLDAHLLPSKFFTFIEQNIHPKILFTELNLKSREGKAAITGEAENFVVLQQQIQIFKNNPQVKDINLAKIGFGKEGKINFTLNLDLDTGLFLFNE